MTDSETVKEIDGFFERRGIRVDISAYGPPLEDIMSKEAIALWKSLGCAGENNCKQIIAIANCDAPESLKKELINYFQDCKKEMAEDKVFAYKTIAELWRDCKSEDMKYYAEAAAQDAAPQLPPVVEIGDDSVRRLSDATGKSVKKAIKPGKGTANERYNLKDELKRIWDKYSESTALKGSLNHKPYHRDVFNYPPAQKEISELRKEPPVTLEEFQRALGAYSDRKYRNSQVK